MNPNDLHEQNTVQEQNPQFPSNLDRDLHAWFQSLQNRSSSSPRGNGRHNLTGGMPYEPRNSLLPFARPSLLSQQRPQRSRNRLWQWYFGWSSKQKLAIGFGILISLFLLGIIWGAIAGLAFSKQQSQKHQKTIRQANTVQDTQGVTDQVPTPTIAALLISNPTLTSTSLPSPTPTPQPTPSPLPQQTPKSVERVNVTATSQMVKKVGPQYRYIFDVLNNDSKSFGGSVTISLYNDSQQTPLAQHTFDMTQPLEPNAKRLIYFDISTGPASQQSVNGVTRFKYAILVNGQQANIGDGEGKITDKYEDSSLF